MNKLYLGIKGHAVCIDKNTGKEIWRTKLKGSWGGVTNIHCDDDVVYAYATGYLYCLNASDGRVRWKNNLPGLGHGFCIFAAQANFQQAAVNAAASQEQTQAAAGS